MIVTRFPPSPTGNLHIGGLRTALFNYLFARANGGKFLLRIEDTDFARNSIDAKEGILQAFDWVGLEYDNEVEYQSQRMDIYKEYIKKLLDSGHAYYCYMSKEELEQLREEQKARGETPHYDRRYRDFTGTPPDIKPAVRIKAPLEGEIAFDDGVKGRIATAAKELDDFIIARSDGTPTYNFTVAIDDALMGVTHVIRGDDHVSNTPKQIVVYQALGFKIPKFYHIPMILNAQGRKMSKRDGATGVMDYKAMGYLPEALINFLVRLGWSHGDDEIFSMEQLLSYFDADDINSSPSIYNESKLLWLNHHYLIQKNDEEICELLKNVGVNSVEQRVIKNLFPAFKERSKTLLDFKHALDEVLNAPVEYDSKMFAQHSKPVSIETLERSGQIFGNLCFDGEAKALEEAFTQAMNVEKPSKFFLLFRLALMGKGGGAPIFNIMCALGRDETLKRLETLKQKLAIAIQG